MTKYQTEKEMHNDDVADGVPYRTEDGFIARKEEGKEILFSAYCWDEDTLPSAIQQAIMDTQGEIACTLQMDLCANMAPERSQAIRGAWGCDHPLVWSEEAPAEVVEARLTYLRHLQRAKTSLEAAVEHLKKAAVLAVELN